MKNQTTHTPGPWSIESDALQITVHAEKTQNFYGEICDMSRSEFNRTTTQANARLISAAPEMLAALKALFEEFYRSGQWVVCHGNDNRRADSVLEQARAAIAKAEGGES